jgi:DNA-binding response OmpR family regulator
MKGSLANSSSPASKTIAVLDDDVECTGFYELFFSRDGFNVIVFRNGKEALDRLKGKPQKVDLIILDLMMPGRGGYLVLKELQESYYKDVPIIIVTACNLNQASIGIYRSEKNVKDLLMKPINVKEFLKKVHQILGTVPPEAPGNLPKQK